MTLTVIPPPLAAAIPASVLVFTPEDVVMPVPLIFVEDVLVVDELTEVVLTVGTLGMLMPLVLVLPLTEDVETFGMVMLGALTCWIVDTFGKNGIAL